MSPADKLAQALRKLLGTYADPTVSVPEGIFDMQIVDDWILAGREALAEHEAAQQARRPTVPGWYVVLPPDFDSPTVRAFGKDGRWWIPLGRGDGDDGWMTGHDYENFVGPIADIDAPQPFLVKAAQQAEPVAFVHWPLSGGPRLVWYSNKALEAAILKAYEGHQADLLLYAGAPFQHAGMGKPAQEVTR